MGFLFRRKASKREEESANATQLAKDRASTVPSLRLNVSDCSLPEFEHGTTTITRTPTMAARPILKRATKSDNSIYLTMYAANNRLARGSPPNSHYDSYTGFSTSSSRSSSTTRPPKQVSFRLESDSGVTRSRPREPFQPPKRLPLTPANDESDGDDWHDAKSDSSTASLASSRTSVDFEVAPIERSGAPIRPTRVAAGFERRMSKLPPIPDRDARPRPKVALGHSKDGQPSWSLKHHRQTLPVH